jgi:hypothetical protein
MKKGVHENNYFILDALTYLKQLLRIEIIYFPHSMLKIREVLI